MARLGLRRGGATVLLVGAFGLAVKFALCAQGKFGSEVRRASGGLLPSASAGEGDGASVVHVCNAPGRSAAAKKLDLTAEQGKALKFKCAPSKKLAPAPSDKRVENVYQYTTSNNTVRCDTGAETSLQSLVTGATLTVETQTERKDQRISPEDVYTFLYDSEQDKAKFLCYTCNTESSSDSDPLLQFQIAQVSTPDCTVYISVPGKPPAFDAPSTEAPHSTSDARPVTVFVATVTGSFLLNLLHLYNQM